MCDKQPFNFISGNKLQNLKQILNKYGLMEIENPNIIINQTDVEVKVVSTYTSQIPAKKSLRAIIRYIIRSKIDQLKSKIMIVNFDSKECQMQIKLVNQSEKDPPFQGERFHDKVNTFNKLDDLIEKSKSIEDVEMLKISRQFIEIIYQDGIQRYINLDKIDKIEKKIKNQSNDCKLFTELFCGHKYYSTSKEPCQKGYQFLYIMQTSLQSPSHPRQIIIKIGKTIQPIDIYCNDLFQQYQQKIIFWPLAYFEIPCIEKTLVDKFIHLSLDENKSENRIYLQGEHLHKEFFLLDRNLIEAIYNIIYSGIYTDLYKKDYSQKVNVQSISECLSTIHYQNDSNFIDESIVNALNNQQKSPIKSQQNKEDDESSILSNIKNTTQQNQKVIKQQQDYTDKDNVINKQQNHCNQSQLNNFLSNFTPDQNDYILNNKDEKNQQNQIKIQGQRYQENNQQFFVNNLIEDQKIYGKGNSKVQNQLNDQIVINRQQSVEVSQIDFKHSQKLQSNNNSKNQNLPQYEQKFKDQDLEKYRVKREEKIPHYSYVQQPSIQEQRFDNYQSIPVAPLPPNCTNVQSFSIGEVDQLQHLLEQLNEEMQYLEDFKNEIISKYDKTAKI
ncbi:hypothetical protein TTHERM_00038850 (macronuclear) [Tetrahymena thermophila SB210]|uniref:Uncharacterized protein n=1 Tax=Tetrahymena thermophila (strain SB210) TaxID=312017 RepID=Q22M34_TETTS|nr:hypothetical protein TTHERM_00038850 [Tetrahymena thermophila SB210]EAR86373.2 hypothetical protein TTHERM_00038850 [Tetrahymena thermophila SB210]|eukprot:XP_977186.2 hypothetical protein TTHERM_00038850 [Tetrahymena thermophila SB210]